MADLLLLPILTALALGALHAFDPDHVAAVTAFVSRRPRARQAIGFGVRWALGHSLAILLAGTVLIVLGVRFPQALDDLLEMVVGVVLIGLGIWLFRRLRVPEEESLEEARRGTVVVGVVHGLAGTAGLLALLPVTLIATPGAAFAYLAAFGIGTIAAMAAYALAVGLIFRRIGRMSPRWPVRLRALAASASVVIGIVWIGAAAL